jgi:hypothetical protein
MCRTGPSDVFRPVVASRAVPRAPTGRGRTAAGFPELTLESSSIPNALAALLLRARDTTGCTPHIYFEWTEGNPFADFLRFFLFGQGEVAPVTSEVLRERNRTGPAARASTPAEHRPTA